MSPALWFGGRAILDEIRAAPFAGGRIYADAGTREGPGLLLDIARLRRILIGKGYRKGVDLRISVEVGGRHTEAAWARRFPRALRFLLNAQSVARTPPQPQ
jgi:hypothetical protein